MCRGSNPRACRGVVLRGVAVKLSVADYLLGALTDGGSCEDETSMLRVAPSIITGE